MSAGWQNVKSEWAMLFSPPPYIPGRAALQVAKTVTPRAAQAPDAPPSPQPSDADSSGIPSPVRPWAAARVSWQLPESDSQGCSSSQVSDDSKAFATPLKAPPGCKYEHLSIEKGAVHCSPLYGQEIAACPGAVALEDNELKLVFEGVLQHLARLDRMVLEQQAHALMALAHLEDRLEAIGEPFLGPRGPGLEVIEVTSPTTPV
uniref:Uncharacterized protein n=1 Tax=Eutreptiella gymnastica TaxID=73025 RepID=A0A7S1NDA7_9EUGL